MLLLVRLHLVLHLGLLHGGQLRCTHVHILRELILGKLRLLVIHVLASSVLLALEFGTFHLCLILLFLHLFSFLLEPDEPELCDFLLNALFSLHLELLVGRHVVCGISRVKLYRRLFLLVGVATGLVSRSHRALSSLAFSDGLQNDLTRLVSLVIHDKVCRTAPITFSFAQELASFARYRRQESLRRPSGSPTFAKCVSLSVKHLIVLKTDGILRRLLLLNSIDADSI